MDTPQNESSTQAQPNTGQSLVADQPVPQLPALNPQPNNPLGSSIIAQMPTVEKLQAALHGEPVQDEPRRAESRVTRKQHDQASADLLEALALDRLPTANFFLAQKIKAALSTMGNYNEDEAPVPQTGEEVALVGSTGVTDPDGSAPHLEPVGLGNVTDPAIPAAG